jgi:hypothetical protein
MKNFPIAPKTPINNGEMFSCSDLPLFYMNDYSKIGLQVSSCPSGKRAQAIFF